MVITSTLANQNYKFTGKERDTESGLDYFGARFYANQMGRWMSPDWADKPTAVPYAELTDPQSLNLYGYVRNSPVNRVDADGHVALADDAIVAGIIGLYALTVYVSSPQGQQTIKQGIQAANAMLDAAATGIHNGITRIFSSSRPGTKGKPDHQQTAKDEAARIDGGRTEVTIPTPGGKKDSRRADAAPVDRQGNYVPGGEVVQVIRPTPAGNIPKREQEAAADLQNATGVTPTMTPVRPVPAPPVQPPLTPKPVPETSTPK